MLPRILALLLLVIATSRAQSWFPPVSTAVPGPMPTEVVSGDLNGDGRDDVVVSYGNSIRWFEGRPGGLFFVRDFFDTDFTWLLDVLDIDADGDVDIAVGGGMTSKILRNLGGGTFAEEIIDVPGLRVCRDLDGDGLADLLTQTGIILHGNAQGRFDAGRMRNGMASLSSQFATSFDQSSVADVSGDGRPDVVARMLSFVGLPVDRIVARDTTERWHSIASWQTSTDHGALFGDLDGDARIDAVRFQSPPAQAGADLVEVLLNRGDGTFDAPVGLSGMPFQWSIQDAVVGDFSGDGVDDLAAWVSPIGLVVHSFTPASYGFVFEPSGASPQDMVGADVDGNGQLDLVAAIGNSLVTYRNLATPTLPAWRLEVVSGHGQATLQNMAWPQPVVARVVDRITGLPVQGVAVTFTSPPNGMITTPATVVSDAAGLVSAQLTSVGSGTTTVSASAAPGASAIFFLRSAQPHTLTPTDGGTAAVDHGESASVDFVLTDILTGTPIVGATVDFSVTISGNTTMWSTTTGTDGVATANFATGDLAGTVQASSAMSNNAAVDWVIRQFWVAPLGFVANFVAISYRGDAAPVPLTIAVDAASTTPVPTPFGTVATSILSPSPSFGAFDGLGVFGPAHPDLVARPEWGVWEGYPASAAGTAIVAQAYGYDATRAYPDCWIVSNPVYMTLP